MSQQTDVVKENNCDSSQSWIVGIEGYNMVSAWTEQFTATRDQEGWKVVFDVIGYDSPYDWGYTLETIKEVLKAKRLNDLMGELKARHDIELDDDRTCLPEYFELQEVYDFLGYGWYREDPETEEDRVNAYGSHDAKGVFCQATGNCWDMLRLEYGPEGWTGTVFCDGAHEDLIERYTGSGKSLRHAIQEAGYTRELDPDPVVKEFREQYPDLKAILDKERVLQLLEGTEEEEEW